MSRAVLEAVPNLSEGRREQVVSRIAARVEAATDFDQNPNVLTSLGSPEAVEDRAIEAARAAVELIDLSVYKSVHPGSMPRRPPAHILDGLDPGAG